MSCMACNSKMTNCCVGHTLYYQLCRIIWALYHTVYIIWTRFILCKSYVHYIVPLHHMYTIICTLYHTSTSYVHYIIPLHQLNRTLWIRWGQYLTGLVCLTSFVHHAPCTMHHAPCTMHHAPCTIHHTPYTHTPYTIHHTPYTIHHTPYTIHHTPYTIHHTLYTIHHMPYIIQGWSSLTWISIHFRGLMTWLV